MPVSVLTPPSAMREARLQRFSQHTAAAASTASQPLPAAADQAPAAAVSSTSTSLPHVDSVSLFNMGFDADAVGRALVQTRGDAKGALSLLQKMSAVPAAAAEAEHVPAPSDPAPAPSLLAETDEEEAHQLELALKMSLEQPEPAKKQPRPSPADSSVNPLWQPPRYIPAVSAEAGPKTLQLVENVLVRDGGYAWQRATAFLDTGNQHVTLIDPKYAARHAIYRPDAASGFGQAERFTTIQGVVPGATTRAPIVTIALKVRDQEMLIPAAVSQMNGHDLLLGADVINKLFSAGYRLGAGSM